jgi:hypothetical protein
MTNTGIIISRHWRRTIALFVLVAASTTASAELTWFEQHPGSDLQVHYVHLTGENFDSKSQRDHLREVYDGCVEIQQKRRKSFVPLPPGGIPEIPSSEDLEIYYGENRSLVVAKGKVHYIGTVDCALQVIPHHYIHLPTGSGMCKIDLLTNTLSGICKQAAPATKQKAAGDPSGSPQVLINDLNRVPAARRAEVLAWAERTAARPPLRSTMKPTGEVRQIAGYRCEVYGTPELDEKCIASPKSDFILPVAPVNGYHPGLLLQSRTQVRKLDAQQVILNMKVSRTLFEIPAGVTPRTSSGTRQ